jgi:hypothetical protein
MNATELANKCELWIEDYDFGIEVAKMIRKQQVEIHLLTEECNALRKQLNDCQTERA